MNDITDLSDTIIAKSDQLNADDLVGMSKLITIVGVSRGNNENPLVIHYDGDCGRPFKPCKTVRRILVAAWGSDGNQWIGKSAQLFCDPAVKYGGKAVGGIRVSGLSDIAKPLIVNLSVTRGKKAEYRIEPLQPKQKPVWPDDKFNAKLKSIAPKIISGERTHEQAITAFEQNATLSDSQKEQIRAIEVQPDPENLFDDGES